MSRDILFDHGNARFSYRISALIVQNGRVLLQCPVGTSEVGQRPTNESECLHSPSVASAEDLSSVMAERDYAFIGGHVEFGETAKDTLVREIREEIHADAVIGDLAAVGEVFIDWGACPDGAPRHCHQIGLYFYATVDESQLPRKDRFFGYDEIGGEKFSIEYLWVPLEKLADMTVYPPEAAQHILSGSKDVKHFTYTELPAETPWPD